MARSEDIHKEFSVEQCLENLVKFISKCWNSLCRPVCQLSMITAGADFEN